MSTQVTRREAIKLAGLGAAALSIGGVAGRRAVAQAAMGEMTGMEAMPMPYELPPLPYAYNALEPVISEEILRIHHDKHHAGYVKGLNATLEKLDAARKGGDMASIQALSRELAFHGSGHALHSLYWTSMTPNPAEAPAGLKMMIERDFGSMDAFKAQFLAATKSVEASGWGVLAYEPIGKRLLVLQAERHEDLTIWGVRPLLCCDVWEHAYYLQYQNNRGAYVDKFWEIIDWPAAAKRCEAAMA
jgi:Fe-Mn family superoxide dismutase